MTGTTRVELPRLRSLIERSTPATSPSRRPAADAQERCDLCGAAIPPEHRHLVDLEERRLLCACRACSLLFDHSAAGGHHYRLVPDRCDRLADFKLDDLQWRALGIPVEMAFFVRSGATGALTAFYPSLAGATESRLPLDSWSEIDAANPALSDMRSDVEALLVRRARDTREAWLVGIDHCYRLVAVVRTHWRGFTGGAKVWGELARFFQELDGRAQLR